MANFTTTTRTICEMLTGKTTPISEVITEAAPLFFNFNFPFYDETKRAEFEQNFCGISICGKSDWKLLIISCYDLKIN